jgi:hypothetical protein
LLAQSRAAFTFTSINLTRNAQITVVRPGASPPSSGRFHGVWAFVQIATVASEREIPGIIAAAVLTGDNVFHLMGQRAILLAKLAVIAAISCPVRTRRRVPASSR